jgi:hypothetical protein
VRRTGSPLLQAADLLVLAVQDPELPYSRLKEAWPDLRVDPLLREGALLIERLRHFTLDRLDRDAVDVHLSHINDLVNRLREKGEPPLVEERALE